MQKCFLQISYTADENGFQAQGDSIPTPVPLPIENLKALAEFEAAYATGKTDHLCQHSIINCFVSAAVPEAASAGQGSPARPGSPPQPSRPGSAPSRPGSPASVNRPQQPSPGGSGGGFSSQQR